MTLDEIYAGVARDLEASPTLFCELSGRCCRFKEADHRLFLTRIEFREMVARGGKRPPRDDLCPWLENGLCGNRDGRALGCRTYFCSDEPRAAEITEKWHAEIRRLHEETEENYLYLSLGDHLRR